MPHDMMPTVAILLCVCSALLCREVKCCIASCCAVLSRSGGREGG